jgi:ribonuclease BN (tRNA processing enzyme)
MPTDTRETCSALVRDGSAALLIDAGTGARRLATDRSLLEGVARLDVVLTHFHLDHVMGLFFLADVDSEVMIWGAGETLEGTSAVDLVETLLASPFAPPSIGADLTVRELPGSTAAVGSFTVESRVQRMHANPTLALRIGGLAWCTDTAYDAGNVDFARGARALFHEAFHAAATTDDTGHTASGEAARLAAAAGVERLVLIHVKPGEDEEALLRHARAEFAATEVGTDGLTIEA